MEILIVSDDRSRVGRLSAVLWTSLFRGALKRVPRRSRPSLYFESFYSIGTGAFANLLLISTVVLKTILGGNEIHVALLAAMFGGSSLLSPLVCYVGTKVRMRSLVVYPNFFVAGLLFATVVPWVDATWFTVVLGIAFVVRVFPRLAEMNMYRILYPATHRGAAVGWVKAIAATSGLSVTLLGCWWFSFRPQSYWMLFWLIGLLLVGSSLSYMQIPVPRRDVFARNDSISPHRAFSEGLKIFVRDRPFLLYQIGFALAGSANHMAMVFVPEVLKEFVHASDSVIGLVGAVLPALLVTLSAPVWGRYLDRVNPMIGRSTFNALQCVAYGFYAYGGHTLQGWPFFVGAALHGISNGGGTINWLTGSLYFASSSHISLYNAVHVCLTGLRGLIAPVLGLYLISESGLNLGPNLFVIASILSLFGACVMAIQGMIDPGPREESVPVLNQRPQTQAVMRSG